MNTTATEQDYADTLVWFLNDARGWTTRNELRTNLHYTDRDIRMARAAAGCGLVISCTKGYKATKNATIEEVREAYGMFSSQERAARQSKSELWDVMTERLFAQMKSDAEEIKAISDAVRDGTVDDCHKALKDAGIIS